MDWIKWTVCVVGHLGLWCVVFNHVHATAYPRRTRKLSEKLIFLAVLLPMLATAARMVWSGDTRFSTDTLAGWSWLYRHVCLLLGCFFIVRWIWRNATLRTPESLIESNREQVDLAGLLGRNLHHGVVGRVLGAIPGNEATLICQQRMTIAVNAPEAWNGFRICQLSDLHFTGQLDIDYFCEVVRLANEFEPDLTVITGDLVDEIECLDWFPRTLGQLQARLGVFYVLGNHDRRIPDELDLRARLQALGLQQAAGSWHEIRDGDRHLQLTGNALPWYTDADSLELPPECPDCLRLLLSHSPDQLQWARRFDFDLMLAGHTHGGQIAFPLIGPVVAPSRHGVKYAAGTFQIGRMLMHVSRGISGDESIRLGSPPELGLITLRSRHSPNT